MGPFDSLKGNSFSTSDNGSGSSRRPNRRNNDDSTRSDNRSYNRPATRLGQINSINMNKNKEEEFPELVKTVKTEKKDTDHILTESSWQKKKNVLKREQLIKMIQNIGEAQRG